jgi:SAM-dependent methyltransferase
MTVVNAPAAGPVSAKSAAWDHIGGMFWRLGRKSAKPSEAEIGIFLDAAPGTRLCIVGASTRDLAEAALARGFELTVLDFSPVMCRDLRAELAGRPIRVEQGDILDPPEDLVRSGFDLVLSDRLVNRFDSSHAQSCVEGHCRLLRPGGEARMSVKLGFYALDDALIREAERQGLAEEVYDPSDRTIDYSKARSVLEAVPVRHGDIPREALIEWYVGRGRESRFEAEQLEAIGDRASAPIGELLASRKFPDAPDTMLLSIRRSR